MANYLLKDFINHLKTEYNNHSIYVWGAQGQTPSEEWIKAKETKATYRNKALKLYRKNIANGYTDMKAFDCSGLGMYWLQNVTGLSKSDMNANGMKSKCTLITKDKLSKGCWVFRVYKSGKNKGRAYHIGYVVDDTLNVIESKGRAYGVVCKPFSSTYWNVYGIPSYFEDEIVTPASSDVPYTFTRLLKKGMSGTDVKELQKLLNAAADANLAIDGSFGTKTYKAVRAYQYSKNLKVDGVAGNATITSLGGNYENV